MLHVYFCAGELGCKKTLKPAVHVPHGAVWWGQTGNASLSNRSHCCRYLAWTGSPLSLSRPSLQQLLDVVKRDETCTAEPGWPEQSGSSPGAAGRWGLGWCRCWGRPVCWWGSRSMTGSAASSGPGPTGTDNDCSESETEGWWQTSRRVILEEEEKNRIEQSLFVFICASWGLCTIRS